MTDTGTIVAFWALAALTLGAAVLAATTRNLLHAVLALILSFIGVAGLYITLSADFVAVAQVLIYAGAIAVLIIFAIMLTPNAGRRNDETFFRLPALGIAAVMASTLAAVGVATDWPQATRGPFTETSQAIGEAMLNQYILPFEIASVLLLVAMLGAIVIVRED